MECQTEESEDDKMKRSVCHRIGRDSGYYYWRWFCVLPLTDENVATKRRHFAMVANFLKASACWHQSNRIND